MKIGIDISQTAYSNTGVSNYLLNLVESMVSSDKNNEYILFFSSNSITSPRSFTKYKNVKLKTYEIALPILDFLWNKIHKISIENLIGDVDVFISSDWVAPPVRKAKLATIIYDLSIYKTPNEMDKKIVSTQKRKLKYIFDNDLIFAISESTKKDIVDIFGYPENKIKVIYPSL